jgi:hypothetical protein
MNEPSTQPNSANQPGQMPGQAKPGASPAYVTDAEKKAQADKAKTAGNCSTDKAQSEGNCASKS